MKKTIAIFSSNPHAYAPRRFAEEARKKGFSAATFGYQEVDLYFASKGERKVFLKGKKITEQVIAEAIEVMKTEISPISDARGTKEYKTLLLGQLIKAHFIGLSAKAVFKTPVH